MKKLTIILFSFLVVMIFIYWITGKLLGINKPVKSNYVLLEGWIHAKTVEDAVTYIVNHDIDSVFVVGMENSDFGSSINLQSIDKSKKLPYKNNTYGFYWNGLLGFDIPNSELNTTFTLHITMRGSGDLGYFPHYKIFVNNTFIKSGFVTQYDSIYSFQISETAFDTMATNHIFINFDNDIRSSTGDRNLYVSDIYLGSTNMNNLASNIFFVPWNNVQNSQLNSNGNNLIYYLNDLGFDIKKVKIIEVNYDNFNKTLALARGAQQYFSTSSIKNINIISTPFHSRRTYVNFKNCLSDHMNVGCISKENSLDNVKFTFYDQLDNRISMLATWVYWWFH